MTKVSYAQNSEDVLLWRALGHIENGFYIDIGAHDPVVDSVSLSFYESGWRGVHVEPIAEYAESLRKHRTDEMVVQAALAAKRGTIRFFVVPGTGLSTGEENVARENERAGFAYQEIRIPAIPLATVFRSVGKAEVHWMKIDVEGMESEVLKGWQSSSKRPWVVVVESTKPMTQIATHSQWEDQLLQRGYKFAHFDGLNRFYVSAKHPELLAALNCGANIFDPFVPVREKNLHAKVKALETACAVLRDRATRAESLLCESVDSYESAARVFSARMLDLRRQNLEIDEQFMPLRMDDTRTFSITASGYSGCLLDGFCPPEAWGTWSSGNDSVIGIPISDELPQGSLLEVKMVVRAYEGTLPSSPVLKIASCGRDLCYVLFRENAPNEQEITFSLPALAPLAELHLHMTQIASPAEVSPLNSDHRKLGIGITRLCVRAYMPQDEPMVRHVLPRVAGIDSDEPLLLGDRLRRDRK